MFQTWKGKPIDRNHLGALSLDKPSGVIMGGWAVANNFLSGVVGQRLEILIETRPGGIGMYCTMPGMMNRKGEEYYEKQFFDKVVELLYGTDHK